MNDYTPGPRSRIKRNPKRGSYDRATVHAILDSAMLAHVAYTIDGQPYCTPTIHWREGEILYWHGSSASRMLRTQGPGLPVCVTVTHLDGLVLARSAFNHSANFRCAMVFGTARLVDEPAEKERALYAVTDRLFPGRNAELRPMTAQEIKATSVVRMDIEEASAKIRGVNVGDDEEDGTWPVWAGVIPVTTTLGTPEPSPVLPAATPMPAHLAAYSPGRQLDEALQDSFTRWQTQT
ncbi:pyridoxamine 5'-phosphate oxidase family protein [Gemmobacter lutimaris]|uniref:Pyridoxamine 5'-phosphate oxidase family protein n=1 Tax=Gemmobacter lutimaris TaxID=2306023 RepID=A0A398BZS1_9RHOB|nr:pyridoxamine 5'-phosphate oxidase family protein [Gemmobacter lutimaris]RID92706.1 pyridoxamine 5'-phosphate oxidase family protein [Gemmobacter lutimaris]